VGFPYLAAYFQVHQSNNYQYQVHVYGDIYNPLAQGERKEKYKEQLFCLDIQSNTAEIYN